MTLSPNLNLPAADFPFPVDLDHLAEVASRADELRTVADAIDHAQAQMGEGLVGVQVYARTLSGGLVLLDVPATGAAQVLHNFGRP